MTGTTLWAVCLGPRVAPRLRLFCFPYAGGGPAVYREWAAGLPRDVEPWAVQLPGRERRFTERPLSEISAIADGASAALAPLLGEQYALFGHSMGATVAFEVARRLRARPPAALVVSAQRAPHIGSRHEPTWNLPEPEFLEDLRRRNGTPAEVLEHSELLALLLPMLRADFQAIESYTCTPAPPLACPVFAYGGADDADAPPELMEAWREHTTGAFRTRTFPDGHFYLHSQRAELLAQLGRDLR